MRNIKDFIDSRGMIGHRRRHEPVGFVLNDFGDSCQRTFSFLFFQIWSSEKNNKALANLIDQVTEIVKAIKVPFTGEIKRHWDNNDWPGRPGSMSRDNITPLIIVLAIIGTKDFYNLRAVLFKRGGFLWNRIDIAGNEKSWYIPPDWIGTRNIATILRGTINHCAPLLFLYPLLIILDISLLIQSIIQVVKSFFEKPKSWSTTDDLNLSLEILFTTSNYPTPLSLLAREIYAMRRPAGDNSGRYDLWGLGPYSAWKSYYRDERRHPPLHDAGEKWLKTI